jgi:hypothetical protein
MAELDPRAVLREWQEAISQLTRGAAGQIDSELIRRLLGPLEGQIVALQHALDQQRAAQEQLVARLFGPIDQVTRAIDDTATAMRGQAAALRQAGDSLGRVAELLEVQASVVEGANAAVRMPTDVVRAPLKRQGGTRGAKRGAGGRGGSKS